MRNRLVIIGLDGGTFKIIDPLIQEGKLPNLSRLIRGGTKAVLKSTIPPSTAPAWVSFMTGMNPGKHGFFSFMRQDKVTYDSPYFLRPGDTCNLLHSGYYAGNTLWDILSRAGYKVSVVMMPMTYPAWEVNGYMLAGYPCPGFKKPNTYPPKWGSEIGHLCDLSAIKGHNEDKLIAECKKLIANAEKIILKQLEDKECDVYGIVFSSTDFAQHFLWKYLNDTNSSYKSAIAEVYMEVDRSIGRMLALLEREKRSIVILSDHGFGPCPKKLFHTNAWLNTEGYLAAKNGILQNKTSDLFNSLRHQKVTLKQRLKKYFSYLPSTIQNKISNAYFKSNLIEWSRTKAFRYKMLQAEGIIINLKARQSGGIVEESDYEMLREGIIDRLKKVSDPETGTKIVKEIYKREELYKGKYVELVPDIVFDFHSNYMAGLNVDGAVFAVVSEETTEVFSGFHDSDGILVLNGQKFKKGSEIKPVGLVDVLPTILFDMELPIPKYVDGRVIKEAFKESSASLPVKYIDADFMENDIHTDLSEEDENVMKDALRGLGYLD